MKKTDWSARNTASSSPKVAVVVQARMASTRLPGKMLELVGGKPMLQWTLERALQIRGVGAVLLATTSAAEDIPLIDMAKQMDILAFAGSQDDVLDRYYQAAKSVQADVIVRLTGDCPLIDPEVCNEVLSKFFAESVDYASNVHPPTFPDGLDTEVFTFGALEIAWHEAKFSTYREHVTQYFPRNPERFRQTNLTSTNDLSKLRWTVDEMKDLEFVIAVFDGLSKREMTDFNYEDVLRIIDEDGIEDASKIIQRNEGLSKSLKDDGLLPSNEVDS